MSNILSASSRTKKRISLRSMYPSSMKALMRPWVPVTMFAPSQSLPYWYWTLVPRKGTTGWTAVLFANFLNSLCIWIASSRVGTTTRAWGVWTAASTLLSGGFCSRFCKIGRTKAAWGGRIRNVENS